MKVMLQLQILIFDLHKGYKTVNARCVIRGPCDKNIGQKLLGLQTYASKWNLMFTIAAQKQCFYVNRLLRLQSTMFLAFA